MYLHLGADTVIPLEKVIAILDLKLTGSQSTYKFISKMKEIKKVIDISDNNAKSFIVTDDLIYLSTISALTLKKRAGRIPETDIEEYE